MQNKRTVPVVFALDDNYLPYLAVSIQSLIDNGSKDNFYKIYAFNTGIKEESKKRFNVYNTENSSVEFVNVKELMDRIREPSISGFLFPNFWASINASCISTAILLW